MHASPTMVSLHVSMRRARLPQVQTFCAAAAQITGIIVGMLLMVILSCRNPAPFVALSCTAHMLNRERKAHGC
jgi:hypothetical protein